MYNQISSLVRDIARFWIEYVNFLYMYFKSDQNTSNYISMYTTPWSIWKKKHKKIALEMTLLLFTIYNKCEFLFDTTCNIIFNF